MPASPNGQAPQDVSLENFPLSGIYAFNGVVWDEGVEVYISFSGKEKQIVKGNGDTITISPGLKGTLINQDGDTFDFVITGSRHSSPNEDGTIDETFNGLNLLGNPFVVPADPDGNLPGHYVFDDEGSYSFTQTRGHATYTYDEANDPPWGPLEGSGQILYIVDDMIA